MNLKANWFKLFSPKKQQNCPAVNGMDMRVATRLGSIASFVTLWVR
jgi:hypothetical protein